jgi:lipopolysaccharide/colanic/teichoic acid biosynthesis glycosyltransferase
MRNSPLCLAIPKDWPLPVLSNGAAAVALDHTIPLDHAATVCRRRRTCRAIISARHAVKYNESLLEKLLQIQQADVILVMADPRLQAYREAATVTTNNEIAGFRRLYADVVREDTCPPQWPHAAFIRKTAQSAFAENGLPTNYNAFLDRCRTQQLRVRSFRVAGQVLDLDQEPQLLQLTLHALTRRQPKSSSTLNGSVLVATTSGEDSNASYSSPRVAGPVLVGRNVEVAQDAILLGPVVICDGARIGTGATVDSAIVGPGQEIPANTIIRRQLLLNGHTPTSLCTLNSRWHREQTDRLRERYRTWPRWSYPALGKRAADIAVSSIALLFFAPVLPFIALAVKLTCPGPVFYRAKRQGRYGREFHCLKFRSMMTGADRLQQLLRKRNQVDGPQFKMENDPRVTRVGAFLRDTYLDEIPQFFNVLAGQMSIVGPAPKRRTSTALGGATLDSPYAPASPASGSSAAREP